MRATTVADCTGTPRGNSGAMLSIIARITIGTPAITKTLPM